MPTTELNLRIGPALKWAILQRAAQDDPVPGVSWDKAADGLDRLVLSFHPRDNLPSGDAVRYVESEGIELLVMQDWLCDMLDGKVLDILRGRLTLLERT